MPRSGLILITVGKTHGKLYTRHLNPERVEYNKSILLNKFNPFRVVISVCHYLRGLHPRLLRLNPFGVIHQSLFILFSVGGIYKTIFNS